MRFLPLLTFATCFAVSSVASAQDAAWPPPGASPQPAAPSAVSAPAPAAAPAAPAAQPAAPPPAAPVAAPPAGAPGAQPAPSLARPTNVDEYQRVRRRLKEELKTAERRDRRQDAERIERDLDTINDWYREDVERTSTGAFVSGIIMTSVGGAAVLTGLGLLIAAGATDAANTDHDLTENLQLSAEITLVSGVALLGGGIPLMVWGGERVMADRNAQVPAPRIAVSIAPGGAALSAAF